MPLISRISAEHIFNEHIFLQCFHVRVVGAWILDFVKVPNNFECIHKAILFSLKNARNPDQVKDGLE